MATSKIEWTDATWNPVTGCSKISEGCKNCYAEKMATRFAGMNGYPKDDPFQVTFHKNRLNKPLHWRKPRMVFVCSMGDLFHEDVEFIVIAKIFGIMQSCPQHTFQVLTKRPERTAEFIKWFRTEWLNKGAYPNEYKHVWLGTTIESQKHIERAYKLIEIPAAVHFISHEPSLGPLDLDLEVGAYQNENNTPLRKKLIDCIQWVICGGESGPGARPMHPDWARSLRDQCQVADVPFFFKQWGEWAPEHSLDSSITPARGFHKSHLFKNNQRVFKVGKKSTGRLLDGKEHNKYPVSRLQVL
jgi:protein gp37